ncbi:hypothetical protein DB42_BQ00210 [Neochlamydia sp. EPS4]|nr:hypothetical protein DB42_BQ00210 [Neochlamydia sp. EPS4]
MLFFLYSLLLTLFEFIFCSKQAIKILMRKILSMAYVKALTPFILSRACLLEK